MESRQSSKNAKKTHVFVLLALTLLSSIERISSLSVTVSDDECVQEYVLYEGDTVSGNFVVVDHEIFWGSDHPGLDFTVIIHLPLNLNVWSLRISDKTLVLCRCSWLRFESKVWDFTFCCWCRWRLQLGTLCRRWREHREISLSLRRREVECTSFASITLTLLLRLSPSTFTLVISPTSMT